MSDGKRECTLTDVVEEVRKIRSELKNAIEASEVRILLTVEHLKGKITKLENENNQLKRRLDSLDRKSRKNNIVVFGVNREPSLKYIPFFCGEIKSLVGVDLCETDIGDIYSLGKTRAAPLKVEFVSYRKKELILRNCSRLEETGIRIASDQTEMQRAEGKLLREYLNEVRKNRPEKSYIKARKLYVGEEVYTVEELEKLKRFGDDQGTHNSRRSNSAPSTPAPDCENTVDEAVSLNEIQRQPTEEKNNKVSRSGKQNDHGVTPRRQIPARPQNPSFQPAVAKERIKTRSTSYRTDSGTSLK